MASVVQQQPFDFLDVFDSLHMRGEGSVTVGAAALSGGRRRGEQPGEGEAGREEQREVPAYA